MLVKLEWLGYLWWKKLWRYVKPFSSDTETSRTDGQTDRRTDRRTELLYQYHASVSWRAIKILCKSGSMIRTLIQIQLKTQPNRADPHSYRRIKFHRNPSITSSDIPLKCKNPVPGSGLSGSGSKVNQFVRVPTFVDTQHFIQIHPRVFE